MKYYFLVTYLPELQRDDKKIKLRLADLLDEQYYIAPEDWRQVQLVLLARDFLLLERLLAGKDAEVDHTLYDKEFWKEQIKAPKEVPAYLEAFFQRLMEDKSFGPEEVNQLHEIYYDYVLHTTTLPFLRDYFQFEKLLRNVLAAIRARRKGLPPSEHILGEGETAEQLGRSTAEDFGLGQEIPWIERLAETRDPLRLEDTIEQILWDYLDEQTMQVYFDFEVILAYLLKLQLLEKRLALSEERGMEIVRHLKGV
jgi:Protein of unknown function (DUF2764)